MKPLNPGCARVSIASGESIAVPVFTIETAGAALVELAEGNDVRGLHAPILLCGADGVAQLAVLPYALFAELSEIIEDVRLAATISARLAEDDGRKGMTFDEVLAMLSEDVETVEVALYAEQRSGDTDIETEDRP
jgi:hypothetical protein